MAKIMEQIYNFSIATVRSKNDWNISEWLSLLKNTFLNPIVDKFIFNYKFFITIFLKTFL